MAQKATRTKVIVSKDSLRSMLENADAELKKKIVGRALVAIFQGQTKAEAESNATAEDNGIGFSGYDAHSGCISAKYYLRHGTLQDWQVDKWLRNDRIIKYHKQLNSIAIAKAALRECAKEAICTI